MIRQDVLLDLLDIIVIHLLAQQHRKCVQEEIIVQKVLIFRLHVLVGNIEILQLISNKQHEHLITIVTLEQKILQDEQLE